MSQVKISCFSYNIHKGFSASKVRFELEMIRNMIRQSHADLVFLQEVLGEHTGHAEKIPDFPLGSQFEYLADQVWTHYAYGKNAVYSEGHHGNVILSKYPIQSWENIDISAHVSEQRGLLHAEILIPENPKTVHAICTHFGLFEKGRKRQVQQLCERVKSTVPEEAPLIISGDFNDWRGQITGVLESELNMKEAFHELRGGHARTFPSWLPMFKLDRLYYRGMSATSVKRLSEKPWKRLSDHLALFSELVLD